MSKDEMKDRISMALKDPILQQGFEIICKENAELKETSNEFGKKRLTMQIQHGPLKGQVHIYETDNPTQKNNRFRVDTGSHYNEFNTMEEAKAFAEEQYGRESKSGSKSVETSRENRINEYWRKIRKETQPVVRMAAELDRGTFDDDVINTMGDGQSMEDLARSLISPAYEEDGYIPQEKLDSARKIIRKRYRKLESEAIGDSASRVLTGDTRIKVRK